MVDLAKGPTTVKVLQRKHKGIERELVLIKDVIDSFTAERGEIEQRTGEVGAVGEQGQGGEQEAGGRGWHAEISDEMRRERRYCGAGRRRGAGRGR